ncbi:hypothetical protein QBC44DRAFT_242665, partial [Cladorrhinum sp. PSN332]
RGWVKGDPIKDYHVVNSLRSGRPKVIDEKVGDMIEAVIIKNSTMRAYLSYEIVEALVA